MYRLLTQSRELRLICTFLLLSAAARAQSADPSRQTELIQQLLGRIDQLEKHVTELESARPVQLAQPAPGPEAVPVASPLVASAGTPARAAAHDHGAPVQPDSYPSFKVSGFGDINYTASDQKGTHPGFNQGQFILHISSALSPHVAYFAS